VDVEGVVTIPKEPIAACSQSEIELQVRSIHCISRAEELPFQVADAARSEQEIQEAEASGDLKASVSQDTRLNGRYIDLRTPANQSIFRVQSAVCQLFREILLSEGFQEIHTPKMIAGASEGGAAVFKFDYMGREGCLAQSPQLYKQMAICADQERVFEIGPVFRAELSYTHRHLTEFVGLDMEMAIQEHYYEVMDVLDKLFVYIFDGLNSRMVKT
jgi:aspartyl-tRNA synthetase